jgi:hypothetical protein
LLSVSIVVSYMQLNPSWACPKLPKDSRGPRTNWIKSSWVISIHRYLPRLTFGEHLDKNIVIVTTE